MRRVRCGSRYDAGTMPLISVALSTCNGARFLREQLDSVLAQSGVRIEVVVVDDGSHDPTAAILADYAARDARIRWQSNERNLGPTASFERAMALCSGDFIAPCDQDDIWHPDKLAQLLAAIEDHDLAYCDSDYMDPDGRPLQRRLSDGTAMLEGTSPLAFLFANSVSGHACLLRRDLFESVRPFPPGAYHDWWLALCAAGRNGVRYLDLPLVRFRRHPQAFSQTGRSSSPDIAQGAAASLAWLEQRHALMQAYARTPLRDAGLAQEFAEALRRAIDHGSNGPLMRLLWRHRRALPRWKGVPFVDALDMQIRMAKKLRRSRR